MRNIIRHIVPLILLTGLTFSNTAFAGLFGIDGFFSSEKARCKIEYTRLDLSTGLQKFAKITTQLGDMDDSTRNAICDRCIPNLANKMNDWMDNNNNIIVNLTNVFVKTRETSLGLWQSWSDYQVCSDSIHGSFDFTKNLISLLDQNKIGYNVNKNRVLEDEEEDED
jgi:hypothetical protein